LIKNNGGFFKLEENGTSFRQELMAGMVGFFTVVYIIAINSFILSEAGIPLQGAVIATILTSFAGCLIMGFWGNAPIILVPGMGINALFSYTMVQSMGLDWQGALAVVFVSGIMFMIVAFTRLADVLSSSIPASLKESIGVGLGFFLLLIGLEKGGLVVRGTATIVALGNLSEPHVLATILTFIVTIFLFMKNVNGHFLWGIIFGTILGWVMGILPKGQDNDFSLGQYAHVFGHMSFDKWLSFPFWIAAFSITMVLVFENIGLVHGHVGYIGKPERFKRSFQANAISAMLSGLFGTSPTVASLESTAAMASGGKTGLTAVVTGFMFLLSIVLIPFISLIPDSAVAPILIIIGCLMIQSVRSIEFKDLSEAIPAILVMAMIPFTYSISDGIAVGFIMYPLLKVLSGKAKEVSLPLYIIALLFLINFLFHF
jgi:AGZA family xanthine/uracil permease-like MFS transporter